MKRLFTILFATMLAGQVWAQDFESDGLFYTITSSTKPYSVIVSGGKASLTNVIIPDSVRYEEIMYAVTGIRDQAFYSNKNISTLKIGNCVQYIGANAFQYCEGLGSISIPNSVTTIQDFAFSNCYYTQISIPTTVTYIGKWAFCYCYGVTTLTISGSVDRGAFEGCRNLRTILISNSATRIGEDAFKKCNPNSVISFADVPPSLVSVNAFDLDIVYVRPTAIDTYNNADVWKLKEIMPFYIIAAKSDDDTLGVVTQSDSILLGNKSITITAYPKNGYHFTKWNDGNTDNPRIYSSTSDTSFIALFEAHSPITDSAVAASCSDKGLTEGSHCSICGEILVAQEKTPMIAHTEVVDASVAATCTESGLTEGKHCSVCNTVLVKQTEIPALGHEFLNYVYNNDATTEADGTETAVCEHGCGATDTRAAEGTKLPKDNTAVSESAIDNLVVYAVGNTIIVENATEEIRVYNAMGALVGCVGRDAPCDVNPFYWTQN